MTASDVQGLLNLCQEENARLLYALKELIRAGDSGMMAEWMSARARAVAVIAPYLRFSETLQDDHSPTSGGG